MNRRPILTLVAFVSAFAACSVTARADVYNLKVVTDANPDYTDMDSLVHSITSNWKTDAEKCWALYYWNHIARRQTNPMIVHGMAETDPIMQFNDYGYTMCSTISGINMSIWTYMGYKAKYYDIAVHTVPEVFYDGRYHLYDNSLSCIYTLADGKTIAGVEDIGKTMAGPETGGKEVAGYIAKYHALNGTSANGFLEGADTPRDLAHLGDNTFKPEYLKYRYYYNEAERGHRYILNLRDGEVYDRHYLHPDELKKDGKSEPAGDPAYFTPNGAGKDGSSRDPEGKNPRYNIRGNGIRTWNTPVAMTTSGDESIYKLEGANVITSVKIDGTASSLAVSTDNGMNWKEVKSAPPVQLIEEVNGAYEVLVKAKGANGLKFQTITQLNGKTQPRLNLGRNTVYVGAGDQTESIVLWPELQGDKYKPMAVESKNIKTDEKHEGWHGVMKPAEKGEGYVVFKIDAPDDIVKITQSARMMVKAPKSEVRFETSFDGGKTWNKTYAFNDNTPPFDDLHDEVTTKIPAGARSVQFKYIMKDSSLYSVRMEADHKAPAKAISPMEVTFNWKERQADYSLVKRSHTQLVEKLPAMYTIDVGGTDHPIVDSLVINPKGARGALTYGYSDGKDVGGEKWVGNWVTYGKNLAEGKPYTVSIKPSENGWGAGDPDGKKLTDGVVGSNYSGGSSYKEGPLYDKTNPEIVVDLGSPQKAAAFRIHIHGYPFQDALRGQVKDACEVLVSNDGKDFKSVGNFDFKLRWKDLPMNFMWPDEETLGAYNHVLQLKEPVEARYVKYAVKSSRKMVITEVQVLDGVETRPFDLKIALPAEGKAPIAAR